tara:strand:+ start:453 stop:803 length:351 start_codon:yes stop_codon:yes gene_type:complete
MKYYHQKFILISISLVFTTLTNAHNNKLNINSKAVFISGNCELCKSRIEKSAFNTAGVRSANWNINTKELIVQFDKEKFSTKKLLKRIARKGHDSRLIRAKFKNYNKLPYSCKYRK